MEIFRGGLKCARSLFFPLRLAYTHYGLRSAKGFEVSGKFHGSRLMRSEVLPFFTRGDRLLRVV